MLFNRYNVSLRLVSSCCRSWHQARMVNKVIYLIEHREVPTWSFMHFHISLSQFDKRKKFELNNKNKEKEDEFFSFSQKHIFLCFMCVQVQTWTCTFYNRTSSFEKMKFNTEKNILQNTWTLQLFKEIIYKVVRFQADRLGW